MEKNTVCIGVEEYLEMRDFIDKIKKGKIYTVFRGGYGSSYCEFMDRDDALNAAGQYNKTISDELASYKEKWEELQESQSEKTKESLDKIAQMSILKFLKWKKSRE